MSTAEYYIGLMSGTSLDGIDGVLARIDDAQIKVIAHAQIAYPDDLRTRFAELNSPSHNEIEKIQIAAQLRCDLALQVVNALRKQQMDVTPAAIADHGQTVRHFPDSNPPYTLQIHQGARLAELSGIDCVVDFRSRDIAAGGQGAPLVPAFHQAFFQIPDHYNAVINIGGIANISLLPPQGSQNLLGFDTGPGNTLMDLWCEMHLKQPFDTDGNWATTGTVNDALLQSMLGDSYFHRPPPKSTGREKFNLAWLGQQLSQPAKQPEAADIQATLLAFTVQSIHLGLQQACRELDTALEQLQAIYICGGGALNTQLMRALDTALPATVESSHALGIPPMQMEAAAFAWLGRQAYRQQAIDLRSATGARQANILGAIYRA